MTVDPLLPGLVVAAYLVGSISFARIVGKWRAPEVDLTTVEFPSAIDGTVWVYRGISATTVTRKVGLPWGLLVVALDVAKGLLPVWWVRLTWPDESWFLTVGVALVVGHVWPVWHRFVGGRGQSTLIGAVLAFSPLTLVSAIAVGTAAGLLIFTSGQLAREGFGLYLWVWPLVTEGPGAVMWFGLGISGVYLLAIRPDLAEEHRIQSASGTVMGYRRRLRTAWSYLTSTDN